jgi:hypothetical protein
MAVAGLRVCWECVKALLQRLRTPVLLALLLPSAPAACCSWTRNDIRQWVGAPPQLLTKPRPWRASPAIQPTSQFFLVRAANQQLLERQTA